MLPLILASAALVAFAPKHATKPAPKAPVVQGPTVEGWIYNQTDKPLAASVGLIPMSLRAQLRDNPDKVVQSLTVKSKKKPTPGFKLTGLTPGLYLINVRAKGCQTLQVPVLFGEEGLKDLSLVPRPEKPKGDLKPISTDANLVKLEALYTAQAARVAKYQAALRDPANKAVKGPVVDWSADAEALSKDLKTETDANTQALAAACYLELAAMMAKLDPATASLALDKLPAKSPWWALDPKMASSAFPAAGRNNDWYPFREALSKENPDPEVRAYGYFAQLSTAINKGDKDKQKALFQILTTEYKTTLWGNSAKRFDPDKQAPAAVPAVPSPAPAAPAPAAPEAPAPVPAPPAPPAPAEPVK